MISTISSSTVVPITTSVVKGTQLNEDGSPVGSSGVTDDQRRIIIGVVVGLGGAIILGGLAVAAYRVWGRKRGYAEEEDDNLMKKKPSVWEKVGLIRSTGRPHQRTPTLHRSPSAPITQASNF